MTFGWNEYKAALNLEKHGVSFDESRTVFTDPLACIFNDELHSVGEAREFIIGHSSRNRLLIVCFTERANGACCSTLQFTPCKQKRT